MKVLVDGKPAALKKGSSFDYVAENRLFLGRDSYSLSITFPLSGCPRNQEIFGFLNRADFVPDTLYLKCEIVDKDFSVAGSLLVTSISASEVKCQFVAGRCDGSASHALSAIYVNELDLGQPEYSSPITPMQAWDQTRPEVALPWINDSYPTVANNWVKYSNGSYSWDSNNVKLSWMPYLIVIAKRICAAIGYSYDFGEWERSDYKYLIICNTLPGSWDMPEYKYILPHWTVEEFFSKLELLLMCEFNFDHMAKRVSFEFSSTAIKSEAPVKLENVTEDFSGDFSTDGSSKCEYIGAKRFAYKESDNPLWPYLCCDWIFDAHLRSIWRYDDIPTMIEKNRKRTETRGNVTIINYGWGLVPVVDWDYPDAKPEDMLYTHFHINRKALQFSNIGDLLYCEKEKTYFTMRSIGVELMKWDYYSQVYMLQPINIFGSGIPDSDDIDTEELEFVPACVMDTYISADDNKGMMLFLKFSEDGRKVESDEWLYGSSVRQCGIAQSIESGEPDSSVQYYDCVYVGFWDGAVPFPGRPPFPIIDDYVIDERWEYVTTRMPGLRLDRHRSVLSTLPKVNPARKYKFSWISSSIPNPRSIFHIMGQAYICEKITATFSEDGMSQLLKGEFYPVVDD